MLPRDTPPQTTRSALPAVVASALALVAPLPLTAAPAAETATPSDRTVTFHEDVAAIFYEHCVSCHRPDEVAPMSLLTYREARPWARAIRKAVADRSMPPWHADSSKMRYANDRSLTQSEIDTIVAWVETGALAGPESAAPAPPSFPDGWRLGEPDLVFRAKHGFVIPVTEEEIPYQSITFDIDLEEDIYIEAWEIRSSHPEALHHANLVRSPADLDGKSIGIASAVMQGGDYIGSYLPGHNVVTYPEGMAYRLPKGSSLGIQVHYVSTGEEVEDWLEFGVHFADGRVDRLVRIVGTDYRDIDIPPFEADYTVVDEVDVLVDAWALTSGIHMHLRGSAYTMEAVRPDGTVALITDVPDYDFDWQSNYELAEPVFMPQGTRLRVTSTWDNSVENPDNPDPSQRVRYGPWTDDEMVNAWTHVVLADEKLGLQIENGRVAGRFPDGIDARQPFLIQSLPQAPSFQKNREKFEAHDGEDGESSPSDARP